jgi:succinate dehydrogenase / fumarate reductase cytochrome b subunit
MSSDGVRGKGVNPKPLPLKYAYFPGCVGQAMTLELHQSTTAVCQALGIELHELHDATCTGARDLHQTPLGDLRINKDAPDLDVILNARTLGMAEDLGLPLMTVCNTCTITINSVNVRLQENPRLLKNTNNVLAQVGRKYNGTTVVKHFVQVMIEDFGVERLKPLITSPLHEVPIAAFYGCHSLRPPKYAFDDPEGPHLLEDLIRAVGAKPIDYGHKLSCCGFHIKLAEDDLATLTAGDAIASAKAAGAAAQVMPCPLCHMALDLWQADAEKQRREQLDLPQFHAPQLIGLALGLSPKQLGMNHHMVDPKPVLQRANVTWK